MQYHDEIYGTVQIHEPVLLELLESEAVTRLQGVQQHGISGLIGVTAPITRFEHSVGAMVLVRRLGGPLQEQIAALLHDVSHTAFSHVIDYVFDGHDSQSYHEEQKEAFVASSDLPQWLARHGYDWRAFLDEDGYPLLEQPSPRLCADRLDYFLRDALALGLATAKDVQLVLQHLVVHDGRIATGDQGVARWLADTYIRADDASWANFREVGLYELTARAIRRALAIGVLDESDFWNVDDVMWKKLQAAPDRALQRNLALIHRDTGFVWDEADPTFVVSTKLRTIDPDVVLPSGIMVPLSELDPEFEQHRRQYLERKEGFWPMRVVARERHNGAQEAH